MKAHINHIVLDDDPKGTPLANVRTEAIAWWEAIPKSARATVLQDHGIKVNESGQYGWATLVTAYKLTHGKA